MRTIKMILSVTIFFYVINATGQVAINNTGSNPDSSAMLDIKSSSLGLLIPRMYTSNRNSISNPATGLIVYVIDLQQFSYFDGSDWIDIDPDGDDDWIVNGTNLYNNTAEQIGIGTDSPNGNARLHINCNGGAGEVYGLLVNGAYSSGDNVPNFGAGTRLSFFPVKGIFRAGEVTGDQWDRINSGIRSVAMGYNTTASGAYSSAFGNTTTASGTDATAFGSNCLASGFYAFAAGNYDTASATNAVAFGNDTKASGMYSTSFGDHTSAESSHTFAMGKYNIGGGNTSAWIAEDPLFEIGNGTYSTPSNALTILKNGNTGLGTHEPDYTLEVSGDAAISGSFIDNNGSSGTNGYILKSTGSGFEWEDASMIDNGKWTVNGDTLYNSTASCVAIGTSSPEPTAQLYVNINDAALDPHGFVVHGDDDGNVPFPSLGAGSRMMFYPGRSAFRAGSVDSARWDGYAVGRYSGAIGKDITASGTYAVALGKGGVSSGSASFSAGNFTLASGVSSSALGSSTHAQGYASFAANYNTDAIGSYSSAMGYNTDADSYLSLAIGHNNIGGGTADSWVDTDPLFEVGNGFSVPTGANALTVLKNGKTGIGTHQPEYLLEVAGEIGIDSKITHSGDNNTYYEMGNDQFRFVAGNASMICGTESTQDLLQLGYPGADIDIHFNDQIYLDGSGGNLGIGVSLPAALLHVQGGEMTGFSGLMIDSDGESSDVPLRIRTNTGGTGYTNSDTRFIVLGTGRVGIGTESPNEDLEVANNSSRGRAVITDAGGSTRFALLLEAPYASDTNARIESYHYGTGGTNLEINTSGDGMTIFGGNVLPEGHKIEDLGADGQAWDNVYCDDVVNQGAAAFTDRNVSQEILLYPPKAKTPEMFDPVTDKGLQELDPGSLPPDLVEGKSLLTDEIASYNYKTNYEQQLLINALLEKVKELENIISKLTKKVENEANN